MSADYEDIRRLEKRIRDLEARLEQAEAEICTPVDLGAVVAAVSMLLVAAPEPDEAEKAHEEFAEGVRLAAPAMKGSAAGEALRVAAELLMNARATRRAERAPDD